MSFGPLTTASDPRRPMPVHATARLDAAASVVAALAHEQRRAERLGLEIPQARAHQELRYWRFVRALCAIAAGDRP